MMDLTSLFDPPSLPPPRTDYLSFLTPYAEGLTPERLTGRPLTDLVAAVGRLNVDEAAELIAFGAVWLNDRPVFEPDRRLKRSERFRLNPPAYGPVTFYEADPNRILYEDESAVIYNKEAGRPSQPVPHDAHNNILSALIRLLSKRSGRPEQLWLTHRLDADTSGLLLLAKNRPAAAFFGQAFQRRAVTKHYLALSTALAPGREPRPAFTIANHIFKADGRYQTRDQGPGQFARTEFRLLDREYLLNSEARFLFQAEPLTGRTHQIRLHLTGAGFPVIGDRFYQGIKAERLMLMSAVLAVENGPSAALRATGF